MARRTRTGYRPVRVLGVLLVLLVGLGAWALWPLEAAQVRLGLDLRGGTQVILVPKPVDGGQVTEEQVKQAVEIIRSRVNGSGVTEAEISTQGSGSGAAIVVSVPGVGADKLVPLVQRTARLNFRPVWSMASPLPVQFITATPGQSTPTTPGSPGTGQAQPNAAQQAALDQLAQQGVTLPSSPDGGAPANPNPPGAPGSADTPQPPAGQPAQPQATDPQEPVITIGRPDKQRSAEPKPAIAQEDPAPSAPSAPQVSVAPSVMPSPMPAPAVASSPASPQAPAASPAASSSASPSPSPSPTQAPMVAQGQIVQAPQRDADFDKKLGELNCADPAVRAGSTPDDSKQWLGTCDQSGSVKMALEPAFLDGQNVTNAVATVPQNGVNWVVALEFDSTGAKALTDASTKLSAMADCAVDGSVNPCNAFAIVLDGVVVSAPKFNGPIAGGTAQIEGSFTAQQATELANVLRYGALPVQLEVVDVTSVSPTVGAEQLRAGLIAGALGLALVAVYLLVYYRALGLVAVASLVVAAGLSYLALVALGKSIGLTLTLAGVAGAIVAIGVTADSFIVYFERIRDELRDGRPVSTAMSNGWLRARRTLLAADFVSILAAAILYALSVGGVRGFALVLGLTTLLDVAVAFLFTRPLVELLGRTRFMQSGRAWTGMSTTSRRPAGLLVRMSSPARGADAPAGEDASSDADTDQDADAGAPADTGQSSADDAPAPSGNEEGK